MDYSWLYEKGGGRHPYFHKVQLCAWSPKMRALCSFMMITIAASPLAPSLTNCKDERARKIQIHDVRYFLRPNEWRNKNVLIFYNQDASHTVLSAEKQKYPFSKKIIDYRGGDYNLCKAERKSPNRVTEHSAWWRGQKISWKEEDMWQSVLKPDR